MRLRHADWSQAAESRRLGAVALAKALTRKVDDATAATLDVANLRRAKHVEKLRGNARVFLCALRAAVRALSLIHI